MSSSTHQANLPATMINESQWLQLNQAIAPLNKDQLTWLSGYLAGLAQQHALPSIAPVQQAGPASQLTILYGSQTGNAKGVAEQYKAAVESAGVPVRVVNMLDYKAKQLKNETHLVIIVSTHGEGDAPDDAVDLHEFLASKKAPKLAKLKYSVLGLGDSSYEFFCQTAKDFDQRLANLGAESLVARVDCDVDYTNEAKAWGDKVLELVEDELKAKGHSQVVALPGLSSQATTATVQQYSKDSPFKASLSLVQKITGRDSVKDIRHIEISLQDSGIEYQPGDALGVWFDNDPTLVDELLALLSLPSNAQIQLKDESMQLGVALQQKLELTLSYPGFVQAYQQATNNASLAALLTDKAALREYLQQRQIIDIVRDHPEAISAQQLVDCLRPLTPRLYSIASSQQEVEDEVHLTMALVDYEAFGRRHLGGASGYLGLRLEEGEEVKVYIEPNHHFRLPADNQAPIIMVGPGTGIAPFRAFMQQREAEEAQGKNWLFFGNPNYTQDFLYQTEWQAYVKQGLLDKVTLAFSRDQEEKIYVQHRLLEQGAEVYRWLEQGAYFYLCGDAARMAKDVENALLAIIQQHGDKSAEQAKQYLSELRKAKRYQKDVY